MLFLNCISILVTIISTTFIIIVIIVVLYPLYYISSTICDFMVDLHCDSGVRNLSCFQFIPLQQANSLKLPLHSQPTWGHSTLLVSVSSKTLGKLLSWWASEINVRWFSIEFYINLGHPNTTGIKILCMICV